MEGGISLNIIFDMCPMESSIVTEVKLMQLLSEAYQQGYEAGKADGKIAMLDMIGKMKTKMKGLCDDE